MKIIDEDGRYGFGEADAPAGVVKSFLTMPTAHMWSRNIGEILIGQDPVEIAALWQKIYEGTFWPGRRGLGIHALSAIDIALHDLAGKQLGAARLQADGRRPAGKLRPIARSIPGLAHGRTIRELMADIGRQFERRWPPASARSRWRCCSPIS